MIRALTASTEPQTHDLGERVGRACPIGTLIALYGNLGAGKTRLTRGIAHGAAIADLGLVSSPTYVLMNIYPANPANPHSKTIYHIDAYRLSDASEAESIDLADCLTTGIVIIEWPERLAALLPAERLDITLSHTDDPQTRDITLEAHGPAMDALLESIIRE